MSDPTQTQTQPIQPATGTTTTTPAPATPVTPSPMAPQQSIWSLLGVSNPLLGQSNTGNMGGGQGAYPTFANAFGIGSNGNLGQQQPGTLNGGASGPPPTPTGSSYDPWGLVGSANSRG